MATDAIEEILSIKNFVTSTPLPFLLEKFFVSDNAFKFLLNCFTSLAIVGKADRFLANLIELRVILPSCCFVSGPSLVTVTVLIFSGLLDFSFLVLVFFAALQ